jgi:uncharacterized membrane protein
VVIYCLTVGVVGGTPIGLAKPDSIEKSAGVENGISGEPSFQQHQQPNASTPETELRIAVHANGSAIWTVHYRFQLNTTNETAAFNRLRSAIASNPAPYRDRFRQRIAEAVARAENTTGREMAVENVTVRATRTGTTGIVTYEFVWRNFAASDGDRLQIGDSLTGFFLDSTTRVTISWPDEYQTTMVRPTPTERRPSAVIWTESTVFTGSGPFLELVHSDTNTSSPDSGANGGANDAPTSGDELPLQGIDIVILLLFVGSLVIIWFARRQQPDDSATPSVASSPDFEAGQETPAETVRNPDNEYSETAENDDRPSLDLLSNEEQVIEVLKRSDGRAKQQQIVETLGWSDTKTSSVVRKLRENGTIDGFRLGRENVLRLIDDENEPDTDDTTNDE